MYHMGIIKCLYHLFLLLVYYWYDYYTWIMKLFWSHWCKIRFGCCEDIYWQFLNRHLGKIYDIFWYILQDNLYQSWWRTPICIHCCQEIRISWSLNSGRPQVGWTLLPFGCCGGVCIGSVLNQSFFVEILCFSHFLVGCGRAGLSLSAYNYDSAFGKKALMMMYRGIMEQVMIIYMWYYYIISLYVLNNREK